MQSIYFIKSEKCAYLSSNNFYEQIFNEAVCTAQNSENRDAIGLLNANA